MTAIVLAGGMGLRLRPVIGDLPKALAPVGGKPLLEHLLVRLGGGGVRRAVLAVGYGKERIEALFGTEAAWGVELSYSKEDTPLGTGGAARKAAALVDDASVLVLNGDTLIDADLGDLLDAHRRSRATATIAVAMVEDRSRFGSVEMNDRQEVVRFGEKAGCGPGLVYTGLSAFDAAFLRSLPAGPLSLEQDVFPSLAEKGLFGWLMPGSFVDIGVPEEYARIAAEHISDHGRIDHENSAARPDL